MRGGVLLFDDDDANDKNSRVFLRENGGRSGTVVVLLVVPHEDRAGRKAEADVTRVVTNTATDRKA